MEYFTKPDCPGQFFNCQPMSAVLSVAGCARMWKEANQPNTVKNYGDRLYKCYRCELGAAHAGESVIACNDLYGAKLCCRCHRPSRRLIHDELCVSCYNREREVIIGKNGRGTAPVKHPPLDARKLLVCHDGKVKLESFARTVDAAEPFVSVLRHMQGPVLFAFRSMRVAPLQLVLPGFEA